MHQRRKSWRTLSDTVPRAPLLGSPAPSDADSHVNVNWLKHKAAVCQEFQVYQRVDLTWTHDLSGHKHQIEKNTFTTVSSKQCQEQAPRIAGVSE